MILSNWLSEQLRYAATDAYASFLVLKAMRERYSGHHLVPMKTEIPLNNSVGRSRERRSKPQVGFGSVPNAFASYSVSGERQKPSETSPTRTEHVTDVGALGSRLAAGANDLSKLTLLCVERGFHLKSEGFQSAPGGFKAVFRLNKGVESKLFVSTKAHASIREAQRDCATQILASLDG